MSKIGQGPRKQTQMCVQFYWGELSGRRGRDRAEETLNSGAVLTWSQPGKLESQVALQMSQIKARGHRALHPYWGSH